MRTTTVTLGLLLVMAGCGGGDSGGAVGSACSMPGATSGQCRSGAVCGMHADGETAATCLRICVQQSDCAATEDCNGVEGTSLKGCRAKSSSLGTSGTGGKK